jgi:hypothetical protein
MPINVWYFVTFLRGLEQLGQPVAYFGKVVIFVHHVSIL